MVPCKATGDSKLLKQLRVALLPPAKLDACVADLPCTALSPAKRLAPRLCVCAHLLLFANHPESCWPIGELLANDS